VLVGEPDAGNPNAVPVEQLAAWRESGLVEWWGFREDMPEVLAACHIFVLPTRYAEGLPVSLLEAGASGRPVVTTTMPGPQDFVLDGETGILVPPGDVTALAEALDRLVRDGGLRGRMGAAGRARVLAKYTSDDVNERTLDLYRTLL
jgi:glycosyltransferase involved in cell wall biosynthesis